MAAIRIEDQGFPKKCGHLDDKELIPLSEYIAKIRAAVSAKTNPNFMLIARTDARAKLGIEEAINRANAALEAGADIAFVEAPQTMDELKAATAQVNGPCLFNYVEGGKTPDLTLDEARELGFKIAIIPGMLMRSVIMTCESLLPDLKQHNKLPDPNEGIGVREVFARFDTDYWDDIRVKFADPELAEAAE